jgi:hypothetical protein
MMNRGQKAGLNFDGLLLALEETFGSRQTDTDSKKEPTDE